jgi:CubicO group peptidase (beta-lactamase class C family)
MSGTDPVGRALETAVEEGVFPGAVLAVRLRGQLAYHRAVGRVSSEPLGSPVQVQTIYDLASLTKPLATTTSILWLVQQGRLALDRRLDDLLPELRGYPIGGATVFHLLTHSSGLPAWRPYYERVAEQDRLAPGFLGSEAAGRAVLGYIRDEVLLHGVGERSVYSDLGFMLLGFIVERLSGQSLATFCREYLFKPLGAEPLGFATLTDKGTAVGGKVVAEQDAVAATERDAWRGRVLCGEVHDENAYVLGGAAGHAGLFGTAEAVLAVAGAWHNAYHGRPSLFEPKLVRRFVTRQDRIPQSSWALGWDTPSVPSSSGSRFAPLSFGHLGYTGTSLWIDPTRELEVVLLSNRVHPTRRNNQIQRFRPFIHDLIFQELVASSQ